MNIDAMENIMQCQLNEAQRRKEGAKGRLLQIKQRSR